MMRLTPLILAFFMAALTAVPTVAQEARVRDLGRFIGWRDNALVGYGLVTGLTGTGDSPRSPVTQQAISSVLGRLGVNISSEQIRSRNVAAVAVTAVLPPSANVGDRVDVTVTSIGDARSLAGGVLLMTPLMAPDQQPYALAQGSIVVGGYQFSSNQNSEQRNFPTAGVISNGATIEVAVEAHTLEPNGELVFVLREASFTTAVRLADAVNLATPQAHARVTDADTVRIDTRGSVDLFRLIAQIEDVRVQPADLARVVVNERTGTIVAGGDVRIASVTVSQGDVRVSIQQRNEASQPMTYGGISDGVNSLIVANTSISVSGLGDGASVTFPNTTVADLMEGLSRVHVDTRGKISILQAIRAAGALHAEIIVQ